MLTIALPDRLETAVMTAAHRASQSVDDYLAIVCAYALSLGIDRARLDSYLVGIPDVSRERASAWLHDLAEGNRTECPR